ncbi:MAG: hypothetical protein NVS2B4_01240 [Ramlibacter sp.]
MLPISIKHAALTYKCKPVSTLDRSDACRRNGLSGAEFLERPPAPEILESDDESAWQEWEQSQIELDSRMGPVSPLDSVKVKEGSPSQMGDLDPYAFVPARRGRGLG